MITTKWIENLSVFYIEDNKGESLSLIDKSIVKVPERFKLKGYMFDGNVWFKDDGKTRAERIVECVAKLVQKGYRLDEKAQRSYEYWGKRYAEELDAKRQKEAERKALQEAKNIGKELKKLVCICHQEGCITTEQFCKQCKFYYQIGCRPEYARV